MFRLKQFTQKFHALLYLRQNNALCSDIEIVLNNIPSDLLSLSAENENDKTLERPDCLEEDHNPLDFHRFNSQENYYDIKFTNFRGT